MGAHYNSQPRNRPLRRPPRRRLARILSYFPQTAVLAVFGNIHYSVRRHLDSEPNVPQHIHSREK